jgi:hypothetical protein
VTVKPPDLPDDPEILSAIGRRKRKSPAVKPARSRRGKVELATARSIEEIGELPKGLGGLAAAALILARSLDDGAGLATAAVARELRATLLELVKGGAHDDGPDPIAELVRELSKPVPAQVGDSAQS